MFRFRNFPVPRPRRSRRGRCHRLLPALVAAGLLAAAPPGARADDEPAGDHHHAPLHFSHPLIAESPSPDTKVRLDVFGLDEEEGDATSFRLEAEYAFHPSFSIELDVPYTRLAPDGGGSVSSLDTVGIGLKFANFAFADKGLLLGYGVELGLPTGDDGKGIGSDHLVEVETFLSLGYKRDRFELVTFVEFGIPTNQEEDDEFETELGLQVSLLYHLSSRLQLLLEADGERVLSGEEEGETVVNLSPGVKVKAAAGSAWWIGAAAGFPLSNEEEFDRRLLLSAFYHF